MFLLILCQSLNPSLVNMNWLFLYYSELIPHYGVLYRDVVVVVVINRAFNCFKGEMKWRVQRKSWLEGFRPRKVKGKIKIEKDRK